MLTTNIVSMQNVWHKDKVIVYNYMFVLCLINFSNKTYNTGEHFTVKSYKTIQALMSFKIFNELFVLLIELIFLVFIFCYFCIISECWNLNPHLFCASFKPRVMMKNTAPPIAIPKNRPAKPTPTMTSGLSFFKGSVIKWKLIILMKSIKI